MQQPVRRIDPAFDDVTAWRRYRQFAISGLIATVSAAGLRGEHRRVGKPQLRCRGRVGRHRRGEGSHRRGSR